jgi:hypothetical protein
MALTLRDILTRLTQLDEITLLEILQITSEDIVERFIDVIEEHADRLEKELE